MRGKQPYHYTSGVDPYQYTTSENILGFDIINQFTPGQWLDELQAIAEKLETLMEGFLVSTTGIFDSRISSLNTQLTAVTDDRADLARRMQSLEDRYFAQLNAMDSLLAEIETTGNFLTQQFEAMKPRKD